MAATPISPFAYTDRRVWRACAAFVTLVLVAVLIGIGFVNLATLPGDVANAPNAGDIALYKRIIAHVQGGESYYTAAVRELRENNYPLRPFVVVRPPFSLKIKLELNFPTHIGKFQYLSYYSS